MNVLALDTCFGACSVAVRWRSQRHEWLLREAYEERLTGHAEALMPMIQGVMEGAGLRFADLDRIAVTIGPGTFTGVRVGVAAARGFGVATGLPLVGVSSLAVMAFRADSLMMKRERAPHTAVCVDARKGQIYMQLFGRDAGVVLSEPMLATPREAALLAGPEPLLAVGSGAAALAGARREQHASTEVALPKLEPHARHLALLSPALKPLDPVRPLYLRAPDARPPADAAIPRVH